MARKAETIRTEIRAIAKAHETLSTRTARCAGWCLEHYIGAGAGDTSLCSYMITELKGKGAHRRALIQWFEKWGQMKLQADGATFKQKDNAKRDKIDLDKALASPYYDDDDAMGKTAVDAKSFNFYGRLKADLKKALEAHAEYEQNPALYKAEPVVPVAQDMKVIEDMILRWETTKDLGKPQPKSDKPVFTGAHKVHLPAGAIQAAAS